MEHKTSLDSIALRPVDHTSKQPVLWHVSPSAVKGCNPPSATAAGGVCVGSTIHSDGPGRQHPKHRETDMSCRHTSLPGFCDIHAKTQETPKHRDTGDTKTQRHGRHKHGHKNSGTQKHRYPRIDVTWSSTTHAHCMLVWHSMGAFIMLQYAGRPWPVPLG